MSGACPGRPSCASSRKDQGEPYDKAELDRLTQQAVVDIVRRQAEAGVDIVNDGEMSKPGYSTYVADRLSGFSGHEAAKPRLDTREHPNFVAAYERMTGANVARRAVCVGPVAVRDREPLAQDLANLRAALAEVAVTEGFMTAASPRLVPVFQTNRHYPTHEAYVEALAAAMQEEYEGIVNAGFVLQLDCPDLAMAHHTSFQDLSEADFLKRAARKSANTSTVSVRAPARERRPEIKGRGRPTRSSAGRYCRAEGCADLRLAILSRRSGFRVLETQSVKEKVTLTEL